MFMLYTLLYVRVSRFIMCDCAVSRSYLDVCHCDVFNVVKVYLYHLMFCVVCIYGRRYVWCGACNVTCNEPTIRFVKPIGAHSYVMYLGSFCFRGELGFLNCDDICMCVLNK